LTWFIAAELVSAIDWADVPRKLAVDVRSSAVTLINDIDHSFEPTIHETAGDRPLRRIPNQPPH
jgi:hypothetical protein